MTFEVELGGRVRMVSVERGDQPGRWRVTLDGQLQVLDVARVGTYGLSILRTASDKKGTGAASSEVHVCPGSMPGELLVSLGGRLVRVTANGRRAGRTVEAGHGSTGDIGIVAPMPGRVVRVLVAAGDEVAPRQTIVVVEAMKMENELRAPRAGRVREVSVTAGTSVDAGRILAVIE
jgi:biotin carboxyl carrier protein